MTRQLRKEKDMNLKETGQLFYQLKLANQELTAKFEAETGFNITRFELMHILIEHAPCTQSFIQHELKIDSAAVTRHLKVLEEKAYVTRERNKDNHREIFVNITETAIKEMTSCEDTHQKEQTLDLSLTKEEEGTLMELLTKIVKMKEE